MGLAQTNPASSPFTCPACGKGLGLPRTVTTKAPEAVTVDLRCNSCGHVWQVERRSPGLSQWQSRRQP